MTFLSEVTTNTFERTSLSPGSYGSGKQPGLKILAYIEKASKMDKSGSMRHSFLVAATRPSKEALTEFAQGYYQGKNGGKHKLNPLLTEPDYEGTAFLSLTLNEYWLSPEATALAFTEASRNKEGVVQADYVAKALTSGEVTQESIDNAVAHFQQVATDKVIAANTPEESMQEAMAAQYRKELTQISIKVGQFLTLQDWKGFERTLQFNPTDLVNTEFSGKIEVREFNGKSGAEVSSIYSKAKTK